MGALEGIWSVIGSSLSPKLVGDSRLFVAPVCGDVGLWSGLDEIFLKKNIMSKLILYSTQLYS